MNCERHGGHGYGSGEGFVTDSVKSLLGPIISRIGNAIALAWGFNANTLGIKPIKVASGKRTYDCAATNNAIVEDPIGVRRERPDHQGLIGRDHDQALI